MLNLIIIRLGSSEYSEEGVLEFLNALFYPHKEDFLVTVQKYIDFSHNAELLEEVAYMSGLGMSILKEGMEKGQANQIVQNISSLMKSMNLSLEQACKAINLELSDYEKAMNMIKQNR